MSSHPRLAGWFALTTLVALAVSAVAVEPASAKPAATPSPLAGTGASQSVSFPLTADAYVSSSAPTTNYGTGNSLRVDASPVVRAYLVANVAGLSGTVTKATLSLYATSSQSRGGAANVVATSWGERTITYANAPAFGAALGSFGPVAAKSWISIDVTAAVHGNGLVGIGLATPSSTALAFSSRSGLHPPVLTVATATTATPAPSATVVPSPTPTPVRSATPSPTIAPTPQPTAVPLPSATPTAVPTATPVPTQTPTPPSTPAPTPVPTATATATPSSAPVTGAYYVAPGGSDAAAGSLAAPWRTPAKAAQSAPAGATIYLRGGTYASFSITRSGLTFAGYPGETAVVAGGSATTDVIEIDGVTGATLRDFAVTGASVQYGAGVRVTNSSGVLLTHLDVHDNTSFGLKSTNASVEISNSVIYENHSGIEIGYGGTVSIHDNDIHNNDKMIDSGVGAQGVSFYKTTGQVTASNNRIWSNHTLPGDPLGQDGTAFEIYGASGVTMTNNVLWDNSTVLETGTSSGLPCSNLRFTGNLAYKSDTDETMGIIVRCGDHGLIANNTFDGLDLFAFDLYPDGSTYGGDITGLRIENNLIENGRAYSIDAALPDPITIDYNLVYTTSASTAEHGTYDAWVTGHDQTTSLASFQSWTGFGAHDLWGVAPLLGANYVPSSTSPAIDRGVPVGLGYLGAAPDLGYREVR